MTETLQLLCRGAAYVSDTLFDLLDLRFCTRRFADGLPHVGFVTELFFTDGWHVTVPLPSSARLRMEGRSNLLG